MKIRLLHKSNNTGFSLIELLAVILVLGVSLAPIGVMFYHVMAKYAQPETLQVAAALAEQEMERVTGLRFSHLNNETLTAFPAPFANYNYEVIVSAVPTHLADDPSMQEYKQVELRVTHSLIDAVSLITIATVKENVN